MKIDELNMNLPLACSTLIMSIVNADDVVEEDEILMTQEIISDFFDLSPEESLETIKSANELLKESTDIFQFGKLLNSEFDYQQKIDFILGVFEVAYSDNELHHLEQHAIRKIADILHIEHQDLIAVKLEIQDYLE